MLHNHYPKPKTFGRISCMCYFLGRELFQACQKRKKRILNCMNV